MSSNVVPSSNLLSSTQTRASDRNNILRCSKIGILLYFFVFGMIFASAIPVFQAPDEPAHLGYINFLQMSHNLPNQYLPEKCVYDEGHQPPLYYILGAVVTSLTNNGNPCRIEWRNGSYGDWHMLTVLKVEDKINVISNVKDKKSVAQFRFVSGRDKFTFYTLRLFSLFTGVGILLYAFKAAELFFGNSYARLLPALFGATLPQFIFNCSSINNDVLCNLFVAAGVYYSFKILTDTRSRYDYILLGLSTGLAICTKKTGLFLLPEIAVILGYLAIREGRINKQLFTSSLIVFGIVALVSGWVFLRNYLVYGELFGSRMEQKSLASLVDKKSLSSPYFRHYFRIMFWESFFGMFGWMNVLLSNLAYWLYDLFVGIGTAGLCWHLRVKRPQTVLVCVALGYVALCFVGVIIFNLTYSQPQGRYLFSVLVPIGILLTLGWRTFLDLLSPRVQRACITICILAFVSIDMNAIWKLYKSYYL